MYMLFNKIKYPINHITMEPKCFCICVFIIHHYVVLHWCKSKFILIHTYLIFYFILSLATHLSLQNYHICFRRASGKCGICFVPSTTITSTNSASSQVNFLLILQTFTGFFLMLAFHVFSFL